MAGYYDVGDRVRLTANFKDDLGADTDPTTVVVSVAAPDGTITSYTYGTDPEVTKASVGNYAYEETMTTEGSVQYRWVATTPDGAGEGSFIVRRTVFA